MFGLNTYAIYAIAAIVLFCSGFVSGCQHEQTTQEKTIRSKEHQYQSDADKIRIEKDAQIKVINNQLVDAISQLRSRPSNATKTINGQDCNGATLSAPDAEFLVREASRADTIRIGLEACYKQYDSIK